MVYDQLFFQVLLLVKISFFTKIYILYNLGRLTQDFTQKFKNKLTPGLNAFVKKFDMICISITINSIEMMVVTLYNRYY